MKVLARLLVVGLVVMVGVGTAQGDFKFSRASLKGLKGVGVRVDVHAEVEENGLTKTAIQTDVELKLRQAGIRVLSEEERLKVPGYSFLYINVNTLLRDGLHAYSFRVELDQDVRLERDPSIRCVAVPTWSVGPLGTIGQDHIRKLRDTIKDYVDRFINAYLSVNPK